MHRNRDFLPGTPHILVIDDSPEDIRSLLVLLRQQPWRLTLSSDARQGYQRAQALRPDLILLDVRMPGMDGFTLCRLLREAPATRLLPIIFLTSLGAVDERLEGLSLGGVDYVLKSCAPEEVLARIRIHLQLVRRGTDALGAMPAEDVSADQVILRAAMRLVGQNLDCMPSLAEIARKVGTHDKRLSAIFREQLGITVFAYVREERLRRGKELLADSGMSVQDISELIGFRSACNFSTAFRERLGMTPSQFREQLQNGRGADPVCRADGPGRARM
ncbi:response regulator [Stutzerimonas kirkiae]|uniref:DNA-binding response regulator n=1 Tax=Stutzerimonas kirkiae TaxID=2211392 RepID=A0A4Q9RCK0_9GAMM|nr:response regulator [Stutzerimonas kirkiae]TBU98083.1 DNA-binding response regulator [Stutzerimonas kirkiae]TBV02896.1 DNA-binding response regulator [Stutzerimonas kirkiae]TBV09153.1 DNA-binding response regulator [Stutzerimonas kirkiae]TBV11134.1 DNA-binding response regulator [Stutzerimonas kirkiae]